MYRKDTLIRIVKVLIGLLVFAFGLYLMIKANIGLQPWDCFAMGIAGKFGITYGRSSMIIGMAVLIIDVLLKERIGIGTVLNGLFVGYFVDFYDWLHIVPEKLPIWIGIILVLIGMFIMALGYYMDMNPGLCFGPRDAMMVGVGKRMRKIPVGVVNIFVMAAVLSVGFILGGPVGIGTLISVFGIGTAMQIVFGLFKFEPRDVINEDIVESIRSIIHNEPSRNQQKRFDAKK